MALAMVLTSLVTVFTENAVAASDYDDVIKAASTDSVEVSNTWSASGGKCGLEQPLSVDLTTSWKALALDVDRYLGSAAAGYDKYAAISALDDALEAGTGFALVQNYADANYASVGGADMRAGDKYLTVYFSDNDTLGFNTYYGWDLLTMSGNWYALNISYVNLVSKCEFGVTQIQHGTGSAYASNIQRGGTANEKPVFINFDIDYPEAPTAYEGIYPQVTMPGAKYVALGDSFSSGEGNLPYEYGSDTMANVCHRSQSAYPRLVQTSLSLGSTAFVACSGAVSDYIINDFNNENMELPQAIYVSDGTEIVTISIGGNDVGFGNTLQACTLPTQVDEEEECLEAMADSYDIATSPIFQNQLSDVFEGIRNLGGTDTQLIVLGYPNLLPEYENISGACTWGNGLFGTSGRQVSENEVWAARLLHDELNGSLNTAIDGLNDANIHFVDPTAVFDTHTLCTATPWINGVQIHVSTAEFGSDSYHPNELGQASFATLIENKIGELN